MHYLFKDLHIFIPHPTSIYRDNHYALYLAHNPTFHKQFKHIEIDCHIICEKLESSLIKLFLVPSFAQLTNVLTKTLPYPTFSSFLSKLNLLFIHSPTYGCVLTKH